jgi:L-ascorbate metabolism protein UlaG (beta-lactamase superfamily)
MLRVRTRLCYWNHWVQQYTDDCPKSFHWRLASTPNQALSGYQYFEERRMDAGFETIGNATLICHDRRPVLVTDPWIKGSTYFGSWMLSHQIPEEQMNSIQNCEFVWISHGHPDHLNSESLKTLDRKKILVPDHVGGLIYGGLKERGYDVHILKDKVWTRLSDRIRILCLCDYNQDAILLIDINGCLIINMNDGNALGWTGFLRKIIRGYQTSFYLHLYGFGDAGMLNFFDEDGKRIQRDPSVLAAPLGPQIARDTESIGAKFFIPFSSMHKYQRKDSVWIQDYTLSLSDYAKGFDSESSTILPAFTKYDCVSNQCEEINPPEAPLVVKDPKEFGDDWEEPLDKSDVLTASQYFQSVFYLTKSLDFINLRVGGRDNIIELSKKKFNRGITFEAPRNSLMTAINYEIFDDMLIGNFMKTTLHGKLKAKTPMLHPWFEPYLPKYADNGRAKSEEELKAYFQEYKKRLEHRNILDSILVHKFEALSKNVFRHYFPGHSVIYRTAKRAYHTVKRSL